MSGRLPKWLFVGALVLMALFFAYPPVRVATKQVLVTKRKATTEDEALSNGVAVGEYYEVSDAGAKSYELVKRTAATEQEAKAHGVAVGEEYEIRRKVVFKRFLPLALGRRSEETEILQRQPDGVVLEAVTTYVEGHIKLGRDLAGGTELVYQITLPKGESGATAESQTINILRQRIDPQNIKEFTIQLQGTNRILIQVPKASRAEVERLKQRLTKMGLLEFKLALPRPTQDNRAYAEEYARADAGRPVAGYEPMFTRGTGEDEEGAEDKGVLILVKEGDPEITGRLLADVGVDQDSLGRPAVGFVFNRQGQRIFANVTDRHREMLLAIILDGKLYSAPVIKSRIAGRGIIEGSFTAQEVTDLVTVLKAGSLPVDLKLLQESTVGPQLGHDSIVQGVRSVIIAGLMVLIFIGIYYMSCGLVADGALILNLVLLIGVLGLLGAALTLPGVAGIVLTVGMAVDANVLIYERIREESLAGKAVSVALRNGYDRAYTTIIDANVTTLLTAVILYLVGTGPVRGFAVTLSVGIVLSMFTSLYVTRLALETMIAKGWLKRFRMLRAIGKTQVRFTRYRRLAYVASAAAVAIGVTAFFVRGSNLYDIDFMGGILARVSLAKPTPTATVRDLLAKSGFPRAEVQGISTAAGGLGRPTDFNIRVKGVGSEQTKQELEVKFEPVLSNAGLAGEDSISETRDGTALILRLKEPVDEMTLRKALVGQGGDPFNIAHVTEVIPEGEEAKARSFTIRLTEAPKLAEDRAVWSDMLYVLIWARLQRHEVGVSLGNVQGGPEPDAPAQMTYSTSDPISGQVLAADLMLSFPEIEVEVPAQPAREFLLKGSRKALEALKRETTDNAFLPDAVFDGWSVTATLPEPVAEDDLRATASVRGLEGLQIIAQDAKASTYRLNLSQEQVKQELTTAFENLDERRIAVEFGAPQGPPDLLGKVKVDMSISEPMLTGEIEHYLEVALGQPAQGVLADGPAADVRTATITLLLPAKKLELAKGLISDAFSRPQPVQQVVSIGSVVANEMKGRALLAVICASILIILYVAVRFHGFRYGIAAVVALVHDVLITVGAVALADWAGVAGDVKINLPMLAAFLTIMGYSLNDTIVVFDRIRENMASAGRKMVNAEIIDSSVNQTLSRTLLTSMTTLMVVLVLYFLGGAVLQGLAFTLIVGILVGTYSSVFIASPILLEWARVSHKKDK